MKMMKRLLLALVLVVLCCTLAACQKKDAAPTATQAPVSANANDVMITIGSETVTRGEYEEYLATITNYYTNYGYDVTEPFMAAMLKQFALQTGAEYSVMNLKIAELGLGLTADEKAAATADAKAQWEGTIQDGMTYYGITDESTDEERSATQVKVLAELESMGYSLESYTEDAVTFAGYDKLRAHLTKDIAVTDEEIVEYYNALVENDKAIYENNVASYEQTQSMNQMAVMYGMTQYITELYYKPAGYRLVTHILLEADEALLTTYADLQAAYEEQQSTLEDGGEVTEELITAEEVENARLAILANVQPTVDEINQKLAAGVTFAELIPQYTTDPGMSDAESIAAGYEVHMDSTNWVTPFRDQAFTVNNIGDVTAPVVTDYGVHILQYVADVPAGPVELTEEMKAALKDTLLTQAQDNTYYSQIEKWITEANVVYSAEAQSILDAAAAAQAADAEAPEAAE